MKPHRASLLAKAGVSLTGAAVAVGALLGFPAMKALAQELKINPRVLQPPSARLNAVRIIRVNPTAARLVGVADAAFADPALAERIFNEPDAVAAERGLSEQERLVLRKIDRELFETARADAERIGTSRSAEDTAHVLPASATDPRQIAPRMVVGRAILAAAGRSYLEAARAHACCPWGHAIELGLGAKQVLYDRAIDAANEGIEMQRPMLNRPMLNPLPTQERG